MKRSITRQSGKSLNKITLKTGIAAIAMMLATPALAEPVKFDIDPQPLAAALKEFSQESGREILFSSDITKRKRTGGVEGSYEPEDALTRLLNGTGLRFTITSRNAFLVQAENEPVAADTTEPSRKNTLIVVTGTNIRGIAPDSSPTKTFDRDDIEASGAATAQEFINKLPENFGGGSNPAIPGGVPNDITVGANSGGFGSYGSSVNLRGLGSGSTLVLVNGHRLAPSSITANFADISLIPASAIERVETLTDGASSIYGSDAVAGVVNFILRDDFDGLEASVRYGTSTQGGEPPQYRASLLGGKTWSSGSALVAYEFFQQDELAIEDRSFARQDFAPSYLLPSQKRNSVFASITQDVGSKAKISADGLYSGRNSTQLRTDRTGRTTMFDAETEGLSLSLSGSLELGGGWFLDTSGTYGFVDTVNETSISFIDVRDSRSQIWGGETKLEGSLFALPAGDVRIALGAQFRKESLDSSGVTLNPIPQSVDRKVYAGFGEAFVPVIAPENDIPGIRKLELNLSGRYSHYSDFGSSFDPKVGVLLSPLEGLNLRGTYSTSFKAPALGYVGAQDFGASVLPTSLLFSVFGLTPADPSLADVVQLTVSGSDNDLDPETSRAITLGADLRKEWGSDTFSASLTWFDINFKNRLGNIPIPGNVIHFDAINLAFDNPSVFPVGSYTFAPSRQEIDEVLSSLETPLGNPFGLDPYDTFFISRLLVVTNTSRSVARGLDFGASYQHDLTDGWVEFGVDGTYLMDFKQQAAVSTPVVEQINTVFNPVDLKMRARASLVRKNFSVSGFVNYVDSYRTNGTDQSEKISSWTTVDLTLALKSPDSSAPILRNTAIRVSITNLFDNDPPTIPLFADISVDGYDPTNASPLGRFVSVELSKKF
ncbi:MAG: iron complex outermembrane receptor protein [Parasphingorhabdus sp.]|jgi:iron complex outermembrane receptor protein|uniref:TonB-dependent receptor domain-containing protein n=1 Tax=Parasphingorhabdus sp. TaxID=2709688 RepID=UPI0039E2414C